MSLLVRSQNHDADRIDDPVELLHHDVAQQRCARPGLGLDFLAVRKVEGDQLDAGVGVTGAVDGVVGVDVRLVSRNESLVLLLARNLLLELREHRGEPVENFRALQVFQKHISLVGGLEAQQTVVIHLVRADDQIHFAVSHLQPCEVTVIIIVTLQRVDLLEEIVAHARLDGDVRGGLEVVAYLVNVVLEGIVVPDGSEFAVGSAPDE